MSSERQHPTISDELAKQWIEWVKMGSDFYEAQIGKALEGDDPVARDFIQRAKRLDLVFVR